MRAGIVGRRQRQSRSRRSATAQCPGPICCGPRLAATGSQTTRPGGPDARALGLEHALRLVASLLAEAIGSAPPAGEPAWPGEPLTQSEARVLRYLPTHMSAPEIGAELYLSPRTVEWHLRKVFTKLGITSRKGLYDVLPRAEREDAPAAVRG